MIINGVEFDQQAILTDSDKFHDAKTNQLYFSEKYYLHFISKQQLAQFQKYKVDFNNKTVTPIK
ncbi:hypothetical protein SD70_26040 [Gordoniibacillus kamchatkensis]|uniref:Uncharacterized protein n=1 Tax=Gordoniibacillus kamchatkensis TaxID=1590651 RepID=A0ABR5ABT1_9BACL|nr:hypothetical protein SD70_26040 [Paenibacillus sp. VKM B-2647]